MTARQIAEYIYSEFSPLSKMSEEESIIHVEQLIHACCSDYLKLPGLKIHYEIESSNTYPDAKP